MKRLIFILILVIILVSLNWFKTIFAQDLSNLTPQQKEELLKKIGNKGQADNDPYRYTSPQIFDSSEARPAGSDIGGNSSAQQSILNQHRRHQGPPEDSDSTVLRGFEKLVPFGMDLFSSEGNNDIPIDIASASDYIIGPGDNLIIYLWGRVEKEYNLTLDREGKVFVPQVGELFGAGMSLEQFTDRAKTKFSQVYSEFDLTVSLGKIRSIRIYVAGEVQKPGAYTVSSLTSLFNALYQAGGPNERGSMRQIRLMRGGRPVAEVDLYKLLLAGDNSSDVRLQTSDVIFVPVAGPRVAIRGEINRDGIYELRGGETSLELLKLAGNPTPRAHLARVMLERISQKSEWEVLDLKLDTTAGLATNDVTLQDGDRITVFSIFEAKKNIVAVFGQVKHPGYYERGDSTRLSDMIERAKLQDYNVYYERADLFRRYTDGRVEIIPVNLENSLAGIPGFDILVSDRDSLHIYSNEKVEWEKYVYIEGEIKNPGRYPLYESMTVGDLIFLAGSFTRGAMRHRGEIARIDTLAEVSLFYLSLDSEQDINLFLQEDDHLYIRQIPDWQKDRTVTIEGEVQFPGKYTLSHRQETLYELIQRVGGFTSSAFPKGIVFSRASIKDNLERLKVGEVIQKSAPLIEDSLGQVVRHQRVDYDQGDMNRIIIDMERILATNGAEGDVVCEPDDRIYIPTIPSGISVIGAVGANGTLKYHNDKNVRFYVERAGNFTKAADKGETRLIKATGEVISGGGILKKSVELGDVVVVPTKIDKEKNFLKTFTTALSAATGVLTSVYIISKL